ncbi:hypothetical protein [Shimia sagamensis]|uniref:DUF883 domain-containing protein n=1 Tax=Shimia sagamensis TaxID=1566352 RepID=A0ABY1NIM0_9RHOB|nr:hypothetical protein [Shimia sagamensis]SMP10125.1 hypothetical protein SAMN06265373_10278 [Shimia sagamensis]
MATKAELEAELAQLRAELARRDADVKSESPVEEITTARQALDAEGEDSTSFENDIKEILADLEELPHKQPLLFALGALTVGYLIGRMK